MTVTIY